MEAQRYPNNFNGVTAGAPAMNFMTQNTFYHGWNAPHDPIKGFLFNRTPLAMILKSLGCAQKSWRRLDDHNQLPKFVLGVPSGEGSEIIAKPADLQPITFAA